MRAIIFRREDPEAWALGPELFRRVGEFCTKYDSDSEPVLIVQALVEDFALGSGKLVAAALLSDEGRVIGHLVITIEDWSGKRYATLIQYELDVALPQEERREWFRWIEEWARARGAVALQVLARSRSLARAFKISYGFEEKRILMRKSLLAPKEAEVRKPIAPGGEDSIQPQA